MHGLNNLKRNNIMKNIHLLPTTKEQHSIVQKNTGLLLIQTPRKEYSGTKLNIYITNDEEIKEGDWCLDKFNQKWKLEDKKLIAFDGKGIKRFSTDNILGHECKKIILATDQDLDGVQAIDDEFLEWFIQNPSCEKVEVEDINNKWLMEDGSIVSVSVYKIIIPKVEHKGKALSEQEVMDNRSSAYDFIDVDKQETLEEAKFRIYKDHWNVEHTQWIKSNFLNGFEAGAKWQQERSYSDEEVLVLLQDIQAQVGIDYNDNFMFADKWFEQFKKK